MVRRWTSVIAAFAVCFAVIGCKSGDEGLVPDPNAGKTAEQRQQEMIDKIKNNPGMPESAKAQALAAVQGHGRPTARK